MTAHLPAELAFAPGRDRIENWVSAADRAADVYTVTLTETEALAGLLLLHAADTSGKRDLTIGYLLGREFWGRGLATELVTGLVDACEPAGPGTLFAGVDTENTASRRVLEKAGFEPESAQPGVGRIGYMRKPRR